MSSDSLNHRYSTHFGKSSGSTQGRFFRIFRRQLDAYEFLCHQQEARDWIGEVLERCSRYQDLWAELQDGSTLLGLAQKILAFVKESSISTKHTSTLFKLNQLSPVENLKATEVELKLEKITTDSQNILLRKHASAANIKDSIKAFKTLGVSEDKLFLPSDLLERRNFKSVVDCLYALGEIAATKGFTPRWQSQLGKVEVSPEKLQATVDLITFQNPNERNEKSIIYKDIECWTHKEVDIFLRDVGHSQYHHNFKRARISGDKFLNLTMESLKDPVGVMPYYHREQLIKAINLIKIIFSEDKHHKDHEICATEEHLHVPQQEAAALVIQKRIRGFLAKKHYVKRAFQNVERTKTVVEMLETERHYVYYLNIIQKKNILYH